MSPLPTPSTCTPTRGRNSFSTSPLSRRSGLIHSPQSRVTPEFQPIRNLALRRACRSKSSSRVRTFLRQNSFLSIGDEKKRKLVVDTERPLMRKSGETFFNNFTPAPMKIFQLKVLFVIQLLICVAVQAKAQTPQFVPFSAAQPVLNTYLSSLPAELKPGGQPTAAAWDQWVRGQDKDIRVRIEQGEENTLVNLLRWGVTYTTQPRITYEYLAQYGKSSFVNGIADKRANDLVKALSAPHPSEGMMEMRALLEKKGYSQKTPADQ